MGAKQSNARDMWELHYMNSPVLDREILGYKWIFLWYHSHLLLHLGPLSDEDLHRPPMPDSSDDEGDAPGKAVCCWDGQYEDPGQLYDTQERQSPYWRYELNSSEETATTHHLKGSQDDMDICIRPTTALEMTGRSWDEPSGSFTLRDLPKHHKAVWPFVLCHDYVRTAVAILEGEEPRSIQMQMPSAAQFH